MYELNLISLESAKALKAVGFNAKCKSYYQHTEYPHSPIGLKFSNQILNHNKYEDFTSIPTYDDVYRWVKNRFRKVVTNKYELKLYLENKIGVTNIEPYFSEE